MDVWQVSWLVGCLCSTSFQILFHDGGLLDDLTRGSTTAKPKIADKPLEIHPFFPSKELLLWGVPDPAAVWLAENGTQRRTHPSRAGRNGHKQLQHATEQPRGYPNREVVLSEC